MAFPRELLQLVWQTIGKSLRRNTIVPHTYDRREAARQVRKNGHPARFRLATLGSLLQQRTRSTIRGLEWRLGFYWFRGSVNCPSRVKAL